MLQLLAYALRLLRLSALMVLVLSIIGQPIVQLLGGIHAVEHAVLADAGPDHGQADHDRGHADQDSGADAADHTQGPHGLMHHAEGAVAAALWQTLSLALAFPPSASPSLPVVTSPRLCIPVTPFRPPIA